MGGISAGCKEVLRGISGFFKVVLRGIRGTGRDWWVCSAVTRQRNAFRTHCAVRYVAVEQTTYVDCAAANQLLRVIGTVSCLRSP